MLNPALEPMKTALLSCRSRYMQTLRDVTGLYWGSLGEVREFGSERLHTGFYHDQGPRRFLLHVELVYLPDRRRFDLEAHLSQGGRPLTGTHRHPGFNLIDLARPDFLLGPILPQVSSILGDRVWAPRR